MAEFMDLAHDGENINNDSLEIRTPQDVFCIRFSPELEKWLDSKTGDSREMQTLIDRIKGFCKQVRSSKNYLLERMHSDQWLQSKITLQNHPAIHVAVASKPRGEDGGSNEVMGSPSPWTAADIDMTVQSNILPRQSSLEKLRSVATSPYSKYLSLSCLLADAGVAGTPGLGRLVYKTGGENRLGVCELIKQLSNPSLENISHVTLPNIPARSVTLHDRLADGLTAEVWKVTISQGVFVKKAFKSLDDCSPNVSMETQIVEKLSHPHIVHTFGCMGSNDPTCMGSNDPPSTEFSLLMECMEQDLSSRLSIDPPLEPLDLLDVLLQVATAMEYLQRVNVIHGDLKTQNILFSQFDISNDGLPFIVVKVADFGSAQALANSNQAPFKPSQGTTKWAAPEVLWSRGTENLPVTEKDTYLDPLKVDVYSFGIMAFEVLTRLVPFDGVKLADLKIKVKDHDEKLAHDFSKTFTDATENYPKFFISFMQRCWAYDPKERPSFHEIIEEIVEAKKGLMNPKISEPPNCRDVDIQKAENPNVKTAKASRNILKRVTKKGKNLCGKVKRKCVGLKNRVMSLSTANKVCPHPESISPLSESSSLKAKTPKRKQEDKTLTDGSQPLVEANKRRKS